MKDWGRIFVGTRLEKQVDSGFVVAWSNLLMQGLRRGDAVCPIPNRVAHEALNEMVRQFLKSPCDSLFCLDSDADIGPNFLNEFRDYQAGWEYDILQAWYPRRGWPPEAIWFKNSILGNVYQVATFDPDMITDVSIVGTHALLARREVFEKQMEGHDPKTFDFFFYPRHIKSTEDAAWAREVSALGFKMGATTHVKAGHISRVTTGWETYQEYLELSGSNEFIERYNAMVRMVAEFTGESYDLVLAKALQSSAHVRAAWEGKAPKDADQVRQFYGQEDNGYLYDLLAWEYSPYYGQITGPLKKWRGERVLVVGAGLGGEVERLKDHNQVDVFELPGVLKRFLWHRFKGDIHLLDGNSILEADLGNYDLVVMIDVAEHIHPDEFDQTMNYLAEHAGVFYLHNNFMQQDAYPMHYDHKAAFDRWVERWGLVHESEFIWLKP